MRPIVLLGSRVRGKMDGPIADQFSNICTALGASCMLIRTDDVIGQITSLLSEPDNGIVLVVANTVAAGELNASIASALPSDLHRIQIVCAAINPMHAPLPYSLRAVPLDQVPQAVAAAIGTLQRNMGAVAAGTEMPAATGAAGTEMPPAA
uniref:hypothetical protein n=1 Tax=Thermogutta sp. TaxID=1962930 RepID=UPI0032201E8F